MKVVIMIKIPLIASLVYNFNNNCLHKYLGDFIVKYYKKNDPAQQSLWNSDVSRLTYIIKELLVSKESIWNHDYKGVQTKNYIVNPLLKHIRTCIDEYWITNIDYIQSGDIEAVKNMQSTYITMHKIRKEIDNGSLSDNIIKYIAPQFYMGKRETNSNNSNIYFIDHDDEVRFKQI